MPWHLSLVGSVYDLPHVAGLIADRLGNLHRLVADVVPFQDDFETRGCSRTDARFRLLADPQTVGGLVAGVPTARAEACFAALREVGYPYSAVIGGGIGGRPFRRGSGSPPMTASCIACDGHKPPDEMDPVQDDVMRATLAKTCHGSASVEEESDESIASTVPAIDAGELAASISRHEGVSFEAMTIFLCIQCVQIICY